MKEECEFENAAKDEEQINSYMKNWNGGMLAGLVEMQGPGVVIVNVKCVSEWANAIIQMSI